MINSDSLEYLISREETYKPNQNYLEVQSNLTWLMRAILVDWMMEVCMEFSLKRESFYLALSLVDRFLSKSGVIPKVKFQLIGVTSMYIACKIEEIHPPKVSEFSRSADYGYKNEQILCTEQEILKVLKWYINPPTTYMWMNWYLT